MQVALDLTGDMIAYSYFDGSDVVTEYLRNTIGFRTKDLFRIDGTVSQLIRMTKDMSGFAGVTATEAICAVPAYCSYAERERLRKAAAACDLNIKYMVRGTFASAEMLFQRQDLGDETILLCSVRSNYVEFLLMDVGGNVLRVMGSATLFYDRSEVRENPEKLEQRVMSELKALYNDLGLSYREKDEVPYITCDERSEADAGYFSELLASCFGRDTVSFENDTAAGAFYHLMKLDDFHEDRIKKLFAVDCCTEGISISSGVGGELVEVFRRNSELPVQKIVDLMMTYDNVLCFYGGNYRNRELDEPIGTCRIPDQYRGQQIHVKVTLTEVGIVEYVVLDAKKQIIYPRRVLS